jgi:hypothetical protein
VSKLNRTLKTAGIAVLALGGAACIYGVIKFPN